MSGFFAWLTKLDWGNVPDWFGAIGTIAAVFVAIYLQGSATKPRVKVDLEVLYDTDFNLHGFMVSIHNYGQVAVNVSELGIGVVGSKKRLPLSLDYSGGVIQQGESITTSASAVGVYDALDRVANGKQKIKIFARVTDALGRLFTSEKQKYDLVQLKDDVKSQRQKYKSNPSEAIVDKDITFHTKKID